MTNGGRLVSAGENRTWSSHRPSPPTTDAVFDVDDLATDSPPDEQLIAALVMSVLPYPYRQGLPLLLEAVTPAAGRCTGGRLAFLSPGVAAIIAVFIEGGR
jgi:hypothetical protein